ncbi:MAG: GPW/gp25 family protein [Candidatus Sericytochromatia bacterium]
MSTGFVFPFAVSASGAIAPGGDDDAELRGKIVQVLFTAPGERVNQQTFGCGIHNLVFDANTSVLASAVEFTAGEALTRWLGEQIVVERVDVDITSDEAALNVAVVYTKRSDTARQSVRITFK